MSDRSGYQRALRLDAVAICWITGTGKAHTQAEEAGKEAPIPDFGLKESCWFVVMHPTGMLPLSIQ